MGTHVSLFLGRICEYDDQEIEYWVNTRTSGVLSREDMQQLRVSQAHEGMAEGALGSQFDGIDLEGDGGFPGQTGELPKELQLEGDATLQETKQHKISDVTRMKKTSELTCYEA